MPKGRAADIAAQEAERTNIERQLQEERERNIERIENETKEQSLRVAIIADSIASFEDRLQKVREHKKSARQGDDWKKFLKCENLPDTKIPSEVREFIYKWKTSLSEYWDGQVNWWLKCDDRSVLTQDPDKDDTRRKLTKKTREPTGKFYDKKLRSMLRFYNSLVDSLRRKTMTPERYEDLITIRDELRDALFIFLDVLTFEVTKHIDREMTSMNPLMASFTYSSPDFVKFLWSFKDVPLPKTYNNLKHIKMEPLPINISVSNLHDLSSSAVRGLWFKYDFYSDYCPSFKPLYEMRFIDMSASLAAEWKERKALTENALNEMTKARELYETKMEQLLKEAEAMQKNKQKTKSPTVTKKSGKRSKDEVKEPEREPPIVDETTYVDVESDYVAFEDAQFAADQEKLSPINLQLTEHEVNMREHQITNGVFKIEFLVKPSQEREINFQMFLRLKEAHDFLMYERFHHFYDPANKKYFDGRKSQTAQKIKEAREKALADLVKVEVRLSDKIFWWECPTVCQWEAWEESDAFNAMNPSLQDFIVRFDHFAAKESAKLFSAPDPHHNKRKIQVADFDLTSPPEGMKRAVLFGNYLVPMIPDDFKFFDEKLEMYERKQEEWKTILELQQELKVGGMRASTKLFTDTRMKVDLRNITIEKYNEQFKAKTFRPRSLFPQQHCKLIEIVENREGTKLIEDARDNFRQRQTPLEKEDVEILESRPMKDEPLLLSEFVREVEDASESLRASFKTTETTASVDNEAKPGMKPKSIINVRQNRASILRYSQFIPRFVPRRRRTKPTRLTSRTVSTKTTNSSVDVSESSENTSKMSLVPHYRGKWSTRDIHEQSYDPATKTVTFYTGRTGTFAFATRKYSNLPLKRWEVRPMLADPTDKHVQLQVITQHVTIEFKISNDGYTFKVTNPKKAPFQGIDRPVKVHQLKQLLSSLNLDIFPEVDAGCYVENVSKKHSAMELHAYKSMAVYCLSHSFTWSVWNRWAHRRVAIFESRMIDKATSKQIMVTPTKAATVKIRERCTPLDVVELDYELSPPEQDFHPDLRSFLEGEVDKKQHRANLRNLMTIWFLQALLINIQPLSFAQ